ncbi:MAG: hypothetical protein HOP06_00470 [Methylotenera sp.]|nr:hypothetical protein [Methylotenera sp.]
MTKKLRISTVSELLAFRAIQEKVILHYKSEENREMAFLACWAILEKFIKVIATEYRRCLLEKSLRDWLAYIDSGINKPTKKPETVLDNVNLPKKSEFISSLNNYGFDGEGVWIIMDSEGKHRRRRNELAHTGRKFTDISTYNLLYADVEKMVHQIFSQVKLIHSD